ncbi:MAG: ClC family H(+)/Cl(-) exchange transporter [Fusobacteriaceae bacterium]|nr:ClC family H(+)/Cl(-) exchange transporter [Fusobacteriaceae bacterium]
MRKARNLFLLSLLTGALTGLTASLYRWGLNGVNRLRERFFEAYGLRNPLMMLLILAVFIAVGQLLGLIGLAFPKISGSGIPQVKGVLLRTISYARWKRELFFKFVTGILGIGCGLSLGREGPSVQLGSYVGYGVTKLFGQDETEERHLVTCGAGAGLAGAFGAPLAGVMFSLEELHRVITPKLLISTFIGAVAADFIGRRFFGMQTAFNITARYPTAINPFFHFGIMIVFAVIAAWFGKLFTRTLTRFQDGFRYINLTRRVKISIVMTTSFLLCLALPEVAGGGHALVESLEGTRESLIFLVFLFAVKFLFTAMSYSTGFAGGIFLPMLVLGAILGKIYAIVLIRFLGLGPEHIPHFIVLGMAAFFVAVVRAPLTGTVLILEMTGTFDHLLALALVAAISYYVTEQLRLAPVYDILYERMGKDRKHAAKGGATS